MKRLFRLIGVVALLWLVYYGTVTIGVKIHAIDSGLSYVTYSCLKVGQAVMYPIYCVKDFFSRSKTAEQSLRELQVERDELLSKLTQMTASSDMSGDCNELVDFKKRYDTRHAIVSQIITKQFLPTGHFFLIDAGSKRGVEVDMVAVYKDCLVGRVSEVFPCYSRVTLITDPACRVAVSIKGAKDHGIHEGIFSLTETRLSYMHDPHFELEKRLKPGDMVLTSGEGLVFPRGFSIGTISSIGREDYNYLISIKPLVDFEHISYCCVMAKGAEFIEPVAPPAPPPAAPKKVIKIEPKPIEKVPAPSVRVEPVAQVSPTPAPVVQEEISQAPKTDSVESAENASENGEVVKKSRRPRRRHWWSSED